jgi:hypothetical protein
MRYVLRIASMLCAALLLVLLVAFFLIRQPAITSTPFRGDGRASAARLQSHVNFLTTVVSPRSADRPENLDRAASFIASAFASAGARVSEEAFRARGRSYRNVIGEFGVASGPVTIVGAHYDAFASTGDLPGADDNASGTAALIELARLLGRSGPAERVRLVAFTTEEPPFFASGEMGSAVDAALLAQTHTPVAAMICLEMIGYYRGDQTYDPPVLRLFYPGKGSFIAVTGGWADRKLVRRVKSAIDGAKGVAAFAFIGPHKLIDASDQRNYWSHGYTAVMVTDTAYLRNPNYHTIRDTADTLDYEKMARVVDGIYSAVR